MSCIISAKIGASLSAESVLLLRSRVVIGLDLFDEAHINKIEASSGPIRGIYLDQVMDLRK